MKIAHERARSCSSSRDCLSDARKEVIRSRSARSSRFRRSTWLSPEPSLTRNSLTSAEIDVSRSAAIMRARRYVSSSSDTVTFFTYTQYHRSRRAPSYLRDVGVAGSNPVTLTIDLIEVFRFRGFEIRHLVPGKAFFGPLLVPVSSRESTVLGQCGTIKTWAARLRN